MTLRAQILRIFLSSPGDVGEERAVVRHAVEQVQRDPLLRAPLYFEVVAYDDPYAAVPMAANQSPQESVNRYKPMPSECDLTVVLLWSRFGTKLPVDQRKPDGSRYESGTEWEYEDALRAGKTVWVYFRRTPAVVDPNDPARAEKLSQRESVERFIGRFTNPDGSLARGYNTYEAPAQLLKCFEQHLKAFVSEQLDGGPRGPATTFRAGELTFPNPSPDLDQYYVDFTSELDAGRQLVGRTDLFANIAEFNTTHRRGYFRVIADAGIGKTTFAAAVALQRNAVSFFTSASRGVTRADQCVNHLCATLIARFRLPYGDLPSHAGDSSALLESILAAAVSKSDGPLWLVVDGLDEADESMGRNVLLLPRSLPDGVFCLVTQAPGDYPLLTLPDTPLATVEIGADSPLQQADIDAYLTRRLAEPEIRARLTSGTGTGLDGVRDRLREASGGNFRYLSYVLADLAASDLPTDVQTLPQGLLSYYASTWSRMEAAAQTKGGKESKRLYRRIVGLLAAAREPVTVGWLAELSGEEPAEIREEVLTTWRPFLSVERRGKTERWRFPDRGFGDFLAEKLVLAEQHATIAAHYRTRDAWRKHDGYASRNLTAHLRLAGDPEGLTSLMDDPAWCESQLLLDPTGIAYQNDLVQASLGAFAADQAELEEGRHATWLGNEIRWAFAAASLRTYRFNVWPALLVKFVSAGIVKDAQAVAWASGIPKPFDRGRTLGDLAPVLSPAVRRKAIETLLAIDDAGVRVHNLLDFAAAADDEERASLIAEALSAATAIPDHVADKVPALVHVAELSPSPGEEREKLLGQAAEVARHLEDGAERADAFLYLVPVSPEHGEYLDAAVDAIRSLAAPSEASDALERALPAVGEATGLKLARAMVDVADRILDQERRLDWLTSALGGLSGSERSELISRIRTEIGTVLDPDSKVTRILALSDLAADGEATVLLTEAEQAIGLIPEGAARSSQLCELAARLSDERATGLWHESVARLTEQSGAISAALTIVNLATRLPARWKPRSLALAQEVVRALSDSMPKARLLINLAEASDDDTSRGLVLDATRIPGGVLAAGIQEPDEIELLELVAALGASHPASSRKALADRAQRVVEGLPEAYTRGAALVALLPISQGEQRLRIVDMIRASAEATEYDDERVELLLAVLPETVAGERPTAIEHAVAAVRAMVPGEVFTIVQVDTETLVATGRRIPELRGRPSSALARLAAYSDDRRDQIVKEAYDLVFEHPAVLQAEAIADLAPYLSEDVVRSTIAAIRTLLADAERSTLCGVFHAVVSAPEVPQEDRSGPDDNAAAGGAGESPDEPTSYDVLGPDGWFRLGRGPLTPIISPSGSSPDDIAAGAQRPPLAEMGDIARAALAVFSHEDLVRADYEVDDAIRAWQTTMGQLLKRLGALNPADAVREAEAAWPENAPLAVCAAVLPLAAGEKKERFLRDARAGLDALPDPLGRAYAWLSIYPQLRGQDRDTGLARIREGLHHATGSSAAELAALARSQAPDFPQVDLRTVVHRVLHSIEERRYLADLVRRLVPVIEALTGRDALSSIASAVLDVRDRWL